MHPESWQKLTVDVTLTNQSNIYPYAVMNNDTIKHLALKKQHQDHTKQTHTKGVCQIFDILYANIVKMYLTRVMVSNANRPK